MLALPHVVAFELGLPHRFLDVALAGMNDADDVVASDAIRAVAELGDVAPPALSDRLRALARGRDLWRRVTAKVAIEMHEEDRKKRRAQGHG